MLPIGNAIGGVDEVMSINGNARDAVAGEWALLYAKRRVPAKPGCARVVG